MPQMTCRSCGLTKDLDEFVTESRLKLGRRSRCKACDSSRNAAYYAANRERERARMAQYNAATRDEQLVQQRAWRAANHEKLLDNWIEDKFPGWTREKRVAQYETQARVCAVCRMPAEFEDLHLDHDHSCCPTTKSQRRSCGMCVRGLVHPGCNTRVAVHEAGRILYDDVARYLQERTAS